MHIISRKKLRQLFKPGAIFGWLLLAGTGLWKLLQLVGAISSGDFVLTASGNSRLVAMWNFLTTPAGAVVLMFVGLSWLAGMVLWPNIVAAVNPVAVPDIASSPHFAQVESSAPQANIVVSLKQDDDYLRLDYGWRKFFTEAESNGLRAVVVEFYNQPNPPQKTASAENVMARIFYYDLSESSLLPDVIEHRTDYAFWLNERSPRVSFEVGTSHYLVLGVFEPKSVEAQGAKRGFMIYQNVDSDDKWVGTYHGDMRFGITVQLSWGEDYASGTEAKFELDIVHGESFELFYLTGETDEWHKPVKRSRGRASVRH